MYYSAAHDQGPVACPSNEAERSDQGPVACPSNEAERSDQGPVACPSNEAERSDQGPGCMIRASWTLGLSSSNAVSSN